MTTTRSAIALPPLQAFRPWYVKWMMRGLNHAWDKGVLPPADLCPERLRYLAEKDTGLSDDTHDRAHFEANLAVLLPALHEEARLTDFGRLLAHGSLLKVMKERLWFEALMAAHPEIDALELAPPIFVVGSMRSGTTRIQRLLASDPEHTALRLYEAHCPVPNPATVTHIRSGRRDPRIRQLGFGLKLLSSVNPAILDVHPTGPLEVDEELGLLEQSLSSAMIEAQRRVPSFARHIEAQDQTPAYARMKRLLKLRCWLTGDDPQKPFVLKTPQHMQDITAIRAVFPQSRLIFLHRDPVQVVASGASLAWNQMVIQSDHVDPHWVGQEWLHKTALRLDRVAKARPLIPARLQTDVAYLDVNADWRGVIARLYDWMGREWTPAARAAMEAYVVRAAAEHGFSRHRYHLENFGLSEGAVREALTPWIESETARAA